MPCLILPQSTFLTLVSSVLRNDVPTPSFVLSFQEPGAPLHESEQTCDDEVFQVNFLSASQSRAWNLEKKNDKQVFLGVFFWFFTSTKFRFMVLTYGGINLLNLPPQSTMKFTNLLFNQRRLFSALPIHGFAMATGK